MKSKSLTFTIFKNTFIVGILVYFFCSAFFMSHLYSYFEEQLFNELETQCDFLIFGMENNEKDFLLKLESKNRITLVDSDGTVIFDNQADASQMENHLTRREIFSAIQNGTSKISRYSQTKMSRTLYYAKHLDNGKVLRISCDQHSIFILMFGMSRVFLIALIIALGISIALSTFQSKKITENLEQIDLDNPEKSEVFDELKPFTNRIAEENYEKKQREELRQQFTANVSHELKTPLTSIIGFAEIMKSGGIDEKTMMDFSTDIYNESQRLIVLINDIIKLSKLDEQSITLEKEKIDLREMSQKIIESLQPTAKERNIEFKFKSCENSYVFGVPVVIHEMIYNLCDNAVKYNRENGFVDVDIFMEDSCLVLKVSDSGIGIPQDQLGRIFERFYCVDKSHSKQLGGTGLGLSIVKHGAKYHNAKVFVKSKLGEGSSFEIKFYENPQS